MDGVSLTWRLLPDTLIEQHGLHDKIVSRGVGADREIRFLYRSRLPVLPVWYGDELRIFTWGHPRRHSPLPRRPTITHEALHDGEFRELEPELIEIPASMGWDLGIWYPIKQGVQGVLVHDADGSAVVYVVTRASTHYYGVMTRNQRQPLLINETI